MKKGSKFVLFWFQETPGVRNVASSYLFFTRILHTQSYSLCNQSKINFYNFSANYEQYPHFQIPLRLLEPEPRAVITLGPTLKPALPRTPRLPFDWKFWWHLRSRCVLFYHWELTPLHWGRGSRCLSSILIMSHDSHHSVDREIFLNSPKKFYNSQDMIRCETMTR